MAGVSDSTMLAIMGHVSPAMLRRYSHIRRKAKVEAMQALEAGFSEMHVTVSPKILGSEQAKATVTH